MCRSFFPSAVAAGLGSLAFSATLLAQSTAPPQGATTLTLERVLAIVSDRQPLIEQARARLAAAEGGRQTAGALPNPVATYFVENARFPGQSGINPLSRETSLYATLPLDAFFQRRSKVGEADADLRAAQAALTTTQHAVALDAARAYYRLAVAQASQAALGENRSDVERLLAYLRARVAEGVNPEGDLIRAEVERGRLDADTTLADVEVIRARAELRPFIGVDASAGPFRVADLPSLGPVSVGSLEDWSARARNTRPELIAARAKVEALTGAVALQRALTIRELGASFGMKRTGGANGMVAGVGISVPVFDQNRGGVQRATAERLAAEQDVAWLERTIAADVEAAYEAAARLTAQVRAMQPSLVSRAEESRQIIVAAYQEGAATLLQVIDASRALTDARLTSARARIAADQTLFELGIAAGEDPAAAARIASGVTGSTDTEPPSGGSR